MNISLVKLQISTILDSPLIANKNYLSIRNSLITKSFHSFSFNNKNIKLSNTGFDHFYNSVIYYNTVKHEITGLHSNHLEIPEEQHNISIHDAYFVNCFSLHDGGVINHFSEWDGNLEVKRCSFYNCYGKSYPADGGCIYFNGNSSTIEQCCAYKCMNYRDGHFAAISLRGDGTSPNDISQCSIYRCCLPKAQGWNTVYQCFGTVTQASNNYTSDATNTQSAAFLMHSLRHSTKASYINIDNCEGPWLIYMYGKDSSNLEYLNIMNTPPNAKRSLIYYHTNTIIKHSVFYNNGECNIFKGKNDSSSLTVEDCTSDVKIPSDTRIILKDHKEQQKPNPLKMLDIFHTHLCDYGSPIDIKNI